MFSTHPYYRDYAHFSRPQLPRFPNFIDCDSDGFVTEIYRRPVAVPVASPFGPRDVCYRAVPLLPSQPTVRRYRVGPSYPVVHRQQCCVSGCNEVRNSLEHRCSCGNLHTRPEPSLPPAHAKESAPCGRQGGCFAKMQAHHTQPSAVPTSKPESISSNAPASKPASSSTPDEQPEDHRLLFLAFLLKFLLNPSSSPNLPQLSPPVARSAPSANPAAQSSDTKDGAAASKGKGKEKSVSFSVPVSNDGPRDVASTLDTLRKIEASFFGLESDFVFPETLDFNKSTPTIISDSDSSSIASVESRLSYTSRNGPVRFYLHELTVLLGQLDAIESQGSEIVRVRRKEVVDRVESALEDVEKKVEARLAKMTAAAAAPETLPAKEVSLTVKVKTSTDVVPVTDVLPIAIESPLVVGEAETLQITVKDHEDGDVAAALAEVSEGEKDDAMPATLDEGHTDSTKHNIDDHETTSLASTDASDDLSSSHITDTTITATDIVQASSVTAAENSDLEQDSPPPYLLRISDEPPSLSKAKQEDHGASDQDGELVVIDDVAATDATSDVETWTEVDA